MKAVQFMLSISVMLVFLCSIPAMGQWATSGTNIYNTNSGYVGIGNSAPATLLYVAKNMTEPTITVRNLGGFGGATYQMYDNASGADWKFKATNTGGFKIRDHAHSMDVFLIEANSAPNCIYVGANNVVGFGTDLPLLGNGNKIDVRGDIFCQDNNAWVEVNNTLANSNAGINFSEIGAYKGWVFYNGNLDILTLSCDATGFGYHMNINGSGQVMIGTTTPATGYKLSVNGKVACEEVLVELDGNWPDYVFADDYNLMSLHELEKSIKANNHLPGLPSAAEVKQNGFELADMQKRVVQKVEELTLYTIEQGKVIANQGLMIEELQKRIEELENGR